MIGRKYRFGWPGLALYVTAFAVFLAISYSTHALAATDQKAAESDLRSLFKQAQKEQRKGRYEEAEKLYRQVIARDQNHTDAKLSLAYLLAKQRRLGEAFDLSYAIAKADPTNSRAFAVLGVTFLTAGKLKEARSVLANALSLSRREHLAWAALGMLEFYENNLDESIANLKEAVYRQPDEPDYLFAYGQVAARAERYSESAESYRRFLSHANVIDSDRRQRIKGLIEFLTFLGNKTSLYTTEGKDQTTLPFTLIGNRPVIKLRINGRDDLLNFVLDTGSGISVISDTTARRLKLGAVARGGHAKGIGGDGKFEIVYGFAREVSIGDVRVRNVPVYIRKFHTAAEDIDGYIGLSLISKFLTTIDYGSQTFVLAKKSNVITSLDKDLSLPLRLTSSGFLSGEVKLEGIDDTFNFIVDTGASVSVISDDIAGLQEMSRVTRGEKMRVIGSAGVTENVPSFMLPRVTFGRNSRESVAVIALDLDLINEASGFQQAGILGGNFLRNYRLTFDFKNSKVIFVPLLPEP